ncbi:hypothetical protein F2Q69_00047634 [Brassica cretica]|uniref:Uncharacterized protein n=1 Tax=Brassica cretica TaxID=69181 RepID=A0A8S9PZ94_BRACR|nr:hypothetical protein F2Q69_00047634 [Brassica cretica]
MLYQSTNTHIDMIMDQPADGDRDGELRDEPAEEDDVLTIPKGPITRARTRKLKEAIGGLIRKIDRSIVSWFKIARSKSFDQVLNKTLRILVDHVTDFFDLKEAMGSEEDDATFMRRNKLLQEAITKQVMEAMVKFLEGKYDQRPNDGQEQASGQRREQRRNRRGQREHAGSEETDNFYERSSHSSEFKSSRVVQEAMGSEEDDAAFMRRNKLLQEAITKQVMEAMVKLLEEKYDQRPNEGQEQASGQRREQRRNRRGQREHAGSEETDNFYERSSHSSGSRHSSRRIDRSVVSWFKIARSKSFDQVLNKTLRILVDHVTNFFDLKVSCDCVLRYVIASIDPYLLNLESSSVEPRIIIC